MCMFAAVATPVATPRPILDGGAARAAAPPLDPTPKPGGWGLSAVEDCRRACLAVAVATPRHNRDCGALASTATLPLDSAPAWVRATCWRLYLSEVAWSWPEPELSARRRPTHCPVLLHSKKIGFADAGTSHRPSAITGRVPFSTAAGWPVGMAVSLSVRGGTRAKPQPPRPARTPRAWPDPRTP